MKKFLILSLSAALCVTLAFADLQGTLRQVDDLHDLNQFDQCITTLQAGLPQATTDQQRAEIYWRLARAALNQGNDLEDADAPQAQILAKFEEGERYADQAIALNPNNHQGYFWKSSNMGRWGQIKGILNSLAKAAPMRTLLERALAVNPRHPDSFYVLGQLYRELPGWPISFGDAGISVSYGRMAVNLNQEEVQQGSSSLSYDFQLELAKSLYARNWNAAKRTSEQRRMKTTFDRASATLERGANFEGSITIPSKPDRDEARDLVNGVISRLQAIGARSINQNNDLDKAREILADW
ncbi:MAG: hypothetical protein A2087_11235 [Spirochaetes bacterium GWD1_61_31]|nr:MAG: hypothetical protein A2Y37_04520 [Spirochaetes bacterium GWB1_60_80]OHD32635.1 MAG: hypothetical protein A2004_05985 [Spirochaetes bacterium GWC1_61_12]OHD35737.1 MAG: hypothetical protein A2087_11235 [Spirochaetes bacterium GWD1_61_31]OHD41903.1 MAG: hypothetical protein A2Y35_04580 [Spirochaetes bacterium GWE1_60_18]OHD57878.1 MAG: hypothetical protein A2Y32_10850 [Spirochaetes bacterium GWF1_60_12]HAP44336.1 hypothetical protein [Spirochaetaceae bacterium]